TPFVLAHLGPTGYGLWAVVGSVLSYGSILDLGLGVAIAKYMAEYRHQRVLDDAETLVATAFWAYVLIGLLALALGAGLALWLPLALQVSPDERQTTELLALTSGAIVGASLPCTMPGAILRGLQRFDLL